jgi:hypothetical protein
MCKHGIIGICEVEQCPQISLIFSRNGYLGAYLSFPDPATSYGVRTRPRVANIINELSMIRSIGAELFRESAPDWEVI